MRKGLIVSGAAMLIGILMLLVWRQVYLSGYGGITRLEWFELAAWHGLAILAFHVIIGQAADYIRYFDLMEGK